MGAGKISGKVIALVAAAFLIVVVVHLFWWGTEETKRMGRQAPEITGYAVKVGGEEQEIEIGVGDSDLTDRPPEVTQKEMARQVGLLSSGDSEQRREAALWLYFSPGQPARDSLLGGLNDEDQVVAKLCAKALVKLWRRCESPTVSSLFRRGVAAWEVGDLSSALEILNRAAALDSRIPDLYRLRAEVYLENGELDKARQDCGKALELEAKHFLALLVRSKCYAQAGKVDRALADLKEALLIYRHFEKARKLQEELLSQSAPAPS